MWKAHIECPKVRAFTPALARADNLFHAIGATDHHNELLLYGMPTIMCTSPTHLQG